MEMHWILNGIYAAVNVINVLDNTELSQQQFGK